MSAPTGKPREEAFVPEKFCDEVYDYVDDNLAEAMDDLEKELVKAVPKPKAAGAGGAADEGNSGEDRSVEEVIKSCCDTMQNSLQREFDRNLDLFDFCVKKAVSGATASAREAAAESASAAMGAVPGNKGVSPSDNSAGVTLGATNTSREGVRNSIGGDPTSCKRGGSLVEWRDSEMEEGSAPKRLEDEKALDANIHRLRKRRREALSRCAAMVQQGAWKKSVLLQDVNDYVEALQMGVSNSFDDNGLTPVPAKVQEAVQSSAALRVTAERAQELTRRLERAMKERVTGGGGESGGGSSAAGAVTAPPPRDLQAIYQRSREQEVVSGDARDNATLEARLRLRG